jgi:Ras-related protein Rab-5C
MNKQASTFSKYHEPKGIKIVVVGPSGVGKTSISNRFVRDEFSGMVTATMGAAFLEKMFEYEPKKFMRMQLWDTAGQEKYRSIAKIYYQDAKIAILVYDVTNAASF